LVVDFIFFFPFQINEQNGGARQQQEQGGRELARLQGANLGDLFVSWKGGWTKSKRGGDDFFSS
jgi:hypothetical protein